MGLCGQTLCYGQARKLLLSDAAALHPQQTPEQGVWDLPGELSSCRRLLLETCCVHQEN